MDDRVYSLKDFKTPLQYPLTRVTEGAGGDLNPLRLVGYQAAGAWIYKNPFAPVGMMDDEVAIADMLVRMGETVRTGKEFYPLAEGCQDHYLWLVAQEACRTGAKIKTQTQPWAK